jgi:hypothetical protein
MLPDSPTLLIAAGIILVIVGVIGGGLKVKEISIPAMGKFARTAGLLIGMMLVVLGMAMEEPATDDHHEDDHTDDQEQYDEDYDSHEDYESDDEDYDDNHDEEDETDEDYEDDEGNH